MSVVSANEKSDGRGGSQNEREKVYVHSWVVVTNDKADDASVVLEAENLPKINDAHPLDGKCTVRSVDPRQVDDSFMLWEVTVRYSNAQQSSGPDEPDPLRRIKVRWSAITFTRPLGHDLKTDKPVVNSAGDWFSPQPEVDDHRWAVSIEANLRFVPIWLLDYQDAVNSDGFSVDGMSVKPGYAKVSGIQVDPWQEEDVNGTKIRFRPTRIEIHLREQKWNPLKLLDQGFHAIVLKKRYHILDKQNRRPVSQPVALDGKGGEALPNTFHWLEFTAYKELSFGVLGLP